ncbi:CocE/NonD family hydrolase [Polymorphobacter sp. PAMC 29334]|uniref:CocE/NonD family hydrolase n=1 Tax=Polymorphobacter sp. PAMC 29334 TaxID=2862331 RepID=UPI001C77E2CC|nr:CocE/NonD family hydrolase [Polymorphobacter sp. PAMC 29334]QYE35144.1 CocE/NonD family hydrolase [Polymorphobacter sp. PAMC 29334]
MRRSFYLPMRDQIRLAVNVYRPAKDGVAIDSKYPVVFAFTPYRARFYDKGKLVDLVDQRTFGLRALVHDGYVVATADIRGKGASFGARRGFLDQTEAKDGAEIVAWLARQPYATGEVGVIGCSYLGGSAMLVASASPPALKAVFSAATDWDKYEFVRRGGITGQFNTRPDEPASVDLASVPVDGDTDGVLLKQAVAQHAGNTPMAPLWYGIPYRDSMSALTGTRFWEEVGPYTHKAALARPGVAWYLWGNWNDEPTEQVIRSAANLPAKLIIGPGSHCEMPKQFDINAIQKGFFDRYLKHVPNGIDAERKYAWWRENGSAGELIRSDTLPGVGVKRTAMALGMGSDPHGGTMALRASPSRTLDYAIDYDISTDAYFPFWPESPDAHAATFTTPPLAQPATIEGYLIVSVEAAADAPEANLFAYLEDVDPSGKATVLAQGRLAASHRKPGTAPYADLDLPYHSGLQRDAEPLVPGRPVTLVFELSPRSYVVQPHHRLRVALAGADPRQRNLAEIGGGLARHWTLYGGAAGSKIEIPFVTPVRFETDTQ